MLQAALRAGTADRRCVFELFPRRLPEGRRYGVVAGVGRVLDAIEQFRFDDRGRSTVLREHGVVDEPTLEWLADYRFTGDIWGYAEGEIYFPYSPLLVVEATFAEAVLLETLLLSILNHDSAIASAASRMTWAAGDRPCIEMGSRRTHEEAAVAAARAAYLAGFAATSNLAARQRYGVPTAGTSAHSFTLLHDTEARRVPRPGRRRSGQGTTLLVDTYDIAEAVRLGGRGGRPRARRGPHRLRRPRRARPPGPRAARRARRHRHPDRASPATSTSTPSPRSPPRRSTATASAPRWSPAAATRPAGFVYKLVAREGDGRRDGRRGEAEQGQDLHRRPEVRPAPARRATASPRPRWSASGEPPVDDGDDRPLLVPLVRDGEVVGRETLDTIRERHAASRAELPLKARQLSRGEPVIPTVHLDGEVS